MSLLLFVDLGSTQALSGLGARVRLRKLAPRKIADTNSDAVLGLIALGALIQMLYTKDAFLKLVEDAATFVDDASCDSYWPK